jgi:serine/threonine protein kinase
MKKYQITPKYADTFSKYLVHLRENFNLNGGTIHKARNELKAIEYKNFGEVIVKSFRIPQLFGKIIYSFFKKTKAQKSYEYALRIGKFTPKPIGYIEFYRFFLLRESFFVSEKFDYDFTIREPLLDTNFQDRSAVFKAFAHFTWQLHEKGIFHDDYSPGNILIQKQTDGSYLFKIVDINRMRFFKLSQKQRAKNFAKLWASEAVLEIIAEEYCRYFQCDEKFTEQVLYYSNKNKRIKNFKKRLKGKPVVD